MSAKRVVLITGGNTGLGLEVVRALCLSPNPYDIIIGSRSVDKGNEAIKTLEAEGHVGDADSLSVVQVDMESDESIAQAFNTVKAKHNKLDILVNNAGSAHDTEIKPGGLSMREAWNKTWNVNVTGTQIMTHTFVPLLMESKEPRVVFITSGLSTLIGTTSPSKGPPNESPPKGWPKAQLGPSAYRSSKTGLNMMMREWVRILKEDGVKVHAVSPGLLATRLGNNPQFLKHIGAIPPARGAEVVRGVVEGERDDHIGEVIRANDVQPF